jgi:hypothetical protein
MRPRRGDWAAILRQTRSHSGIGRSKARRHARDPLRRIFQLDLVLLHAPSVWDFRNEVILEGPLADVIPSTTQFEMYPIGLTSLAAHLEANNYSLARAIVRSSSSSPMKAVWCRRVRHSRNQRSAQLRRRT